MISKSKLFLLNYWGVSLEVLDKATISDATQIENTVCTGFGDKLIYWSIGYYLSTITDFELLIPSRIWPEFLFLDLPNTKVSKISLIKIPNNYKKITVVDALKCIKNRTNQIKFDQNKNYYFDFSMREISSSHFAYHKLDYLFEGFKKIKFKNHLANQYIEKNFSNMVSIHLRRGLFCDLSKSVEYIKELINTIGEDKVLKYYGSLEFLSPQNLKYSRFTILPDSFYFYLIDRLLEKNPEQKIYVSTDVPNYLMSHYFERYPNNIVTKDQYLNEFKVFFEDILKKNETSNYYYSPYQTISDLLDFFVLSNSKMMISSGESQWSFLTKIYKKKVIINAHSTYRKYLNK